MRIELIHAYSVFNIGAGVSPVLNRTYKKGTRGYWVAKCPRSDYFSFIKFDGDSKQRRIGKAFWRTISPLEQLAEIELDDTAQVEQSHNDNKAP